MDTVHSLRRRFTLQEMIAVAVMVAAALFAGYYSAKYLVINADATISVYLFKDGKAWGDVFLANWHTNILKIPLLFIQAHLPFTMLTFTLVNVGLLFATIAGWASVAAWTFGRKVFVPLALVLALVLSASVSLPNELAFTTIRNIEYPLFFGLVVAFWRLVSRLQKGQPFREIRWASLLFLGLMVLLQISDPLFSYASAPALLVVIGIKAFGRAYSKRALAYGIGYAVLPYLIAKVTLLALVRVHAFQYYAGDLVPTVYSFTQLPQQAWEGVYDLIRLFNADIFGMPLHAGYLNRYLLLGLFLACAWGYIRAWKKIKQYIATVPEFATLLISTGIIFLLYIATTGFQEQLRYLVIVLFVMTTSLVVTCHEGNAYASLARGKYGRLFVVGLLALIGIMAGLAYHQYKSINFFDYQQNRNNLQAIDHYLDENHINTVVAGHSYVSTTDFWDGGRLHFAPVLYCNQNLPFLTRESWYQIRPDTSNNVAMIVDKTGRDSGSWQCTTDSLFSYYGLPLASTTLPGVDNKPVTIYIYPKTILKKIKISRQASQIVPQLAH